MRFEPLEQAWAAGQIVPLATEAEQQQLKAAFGDADPGAVLLDLQRRFGPGVLVGSGGSSGARRWCLQPLSHLQASARATGTWLEGLGIDPAACRHLNPLPVHHVSGLLPWLRCQQWGAQHHQLDPDLMRDGAALVSMLPAAGLRAQGPVLLSLVPTQLRRLIAVPAAAAWLQQLALIWVGGAPLPSDLAAAARALELPLAPCYGSTETAAMVCALPPARFLAGDGGCGQPLADVQLRLDPSGALEVATARLSPGWLAAGQWQPLPRSADGWWRSGDAAQLGAAGLQILGRLDGAIHSGGETVFPEQVEQRLRALLAAAGLPVAELLLLDEPDPLWGQRLVALYRLAPAPQSIDPALVKELETLARQLPGHERPACWLHCPELAPTAAGKWQRPGWRRWLERARSNAAAEQA